MYGMLVKLEIVVYSRGCVQSQSFSNIDLIPNQLTVSDKRLNPPEHNAQFNAEAKQAQGNNKRRSKPTKHSSNEDKGWNDENPHVKNSKKRYIAQLMQKKSSPSKKIREREKDKKKIEESWSCKPISSRVRRTSGPQSIKVVCVLLFVLLLSLPHDLIRIKRNWKNNRSVSQRRLVKQSELNKDQKVVSCAKWLKN